MTTLAPQGGLGQSWFVLELSVSEEVVGSLDVRNRSGMTVSVRNPVKVTLASVQKASLEVGVRKIALELRKKGE